MSMTKWIAALSVVALAPLSASCDLLECGEGTQERNGTCVAAEGATPEVQYCESGTHWDESLMACVPDFPPTLCDPETTEEVIDEDGIIWCEGVGGTPTCDSEITCPSPDGGKVTVCGRLYDTETGEPLVGEGTSACTEATTDGPCSVDLKVYDALDFAQGNTNPLPTDEIVVDQCGRFRIKNFSEPAFGFAGIGADDAGGADLYPLTGVAFPASAGKKEGVRAYVTRRSTDEAWTQSAQEPFGTQTFSERGTYLAIFLHGGQRVPGVQITRSGTTQGDNAYYFADEDDAISEINVGLDATGPNGAGIVVDVSLGEMSGTGGELPAECAWPTPNGVALEDVVFVQEMVAEKNDGSGDPCPAE